MNRKKIHALNPLLTFCLLCFMASQAIAAPTQTQPVLQKVSLQLSWKHQFQFAGFYAAVEQGYYAEQGLDVEIREFQENRNPIVEVPAGRADFGIYSDDFIFERMEGKPVKLLANYFKRFPLIFLSQPGLKTLSDLQGRKLMISNHPVSSMTVRAAFHKAGLVPGENLEIVPQSFDIGSLVRGEVDAFSAFRSNEPFFLDRQNLPYEVIELADALPSLGGVNLFTSEAQAAVHPERTRAFVAASNRGWRYALDHPEETVDLILHSYKPMSTREALLFEAEKTRELILPETYPIGSIIDERIQSVVQGFMVVDYHDDIAPLHGLLFDHSKIDWSTDAASQPESESLLTVQEQEWLADNPEITLGYTAAFPPTAFVDSKGEPYGIVSDFLQLINQRLGTDIKLTLSDWPDIVRQAGKRQVDGLGLSLPVASRSHLYDYSDPLFQTYLYLYVRSDETMPIRGVAERAGEKIGYMKNVRIVEQYLEQHEEVIAVPFPKPVDAVTALLAGICPDYQQRACGNHRSGTPDNT